MVDTWVGETIIMVGADGSAISGEISGETGDAATTGTTVGTGTGIGTATIPHITLDTTSGGSEVKARKDVANRRNVVAPSFLFFAFVFRDHNLGGANSKA